MSETRVIPRAELSQRTNDEMRDKKRKKNAEYIGYHKRISEKCRRRRHKKS